MEGESVSSSGPPSKKLKQARLPFKILPSKSPVQNADGPITPPAPNNVKKRKLSESAPGPPKPPKTPKSNEKPRNVTPKDDRTENEVSSSSEADHAAVASGTLVDENACPAQQKPLPRGKGLMYKYIQVTPTQKPEISTSTTDNVVDLTEDNEAEAKVVCVINDEETVTCDAPVPCCVEIPENGDAVISISEALRAESAKDSISSLDKTPEKVTSNKTSEKTPKAISKSPDTDAKAPTGSPKQAEDEKDDDLDAVCSSLNSSIDSLESEPSAESPKQGTTTPKSQVGRPKTPMLSAKKIEKEAEKKRIKEEKEKLKAEKQRQKEEAKAEKERLKQEEKERKEKERQEAKEKKEKEKQEKQEQIQKEKEQKQKQKEMEKREKEQQKEEERRKKQELIDAKNEEKRKKEEEKLKEEEEKNLKKQKEKAFFTKFFTKSEKQDLAKAGETMSCGPFMAFEVKKDMRLAPWLRVEESVREEKMQRLDQEMSTPAQARESLYVAKLKHKPRQRLVGKSAKTWPLEESEVEILDESDEPQAQPKEKMPAKLLQFHENYRPAYYGTWRKKSRHLRARNPFKMDKVLFDYEVDSDEEWEEEEPGESLSNSEGEGEDSDGEGGDDEDEDGFFVPHGYLSEGEGCESDEEEVSPEKLKARQLAKARAWEMEMGKKCEILRPVCIGCCWMGEEETGESRAEAHHLERLSRFSAVVLDVRRPIPCQSSQQSSNKDGKDKDDKEGQRRGAKLMPVPDEAMADLVRLVHGNVSGVKKLIREFREFWKLKSNSPTPSTKADAPPTTNDSQSDSSQPSQSNSTNESKDNEEEEDKHLISKRQLDAKIKDIAVYEKRDVYFRKCWYVHDAMQEKYGLKDLPVPSAWEWVTHRTPRKAKKRPQATTEETEKDMKAEDAKPGGKKQAITPPSSGPSMKKFTVQRSSPLFVSPAPAKPTPPPSEPTTPCLKQLMASPSPLTTPKSTPTNPSLTNTPKGQSIKKSLAPAALFSPGPSAASAGSPQGAPKASPASVEKAAKSSALEKMLSRMSSKTPPPTKTVTGASVTTTSSPSQAVVPGASAECPMEID